MSRLRLLPILLFALVSLFVVKAVDLLGRGGVAVNGHRQTKRACSG